MAEYIEREKVIEIAKDEYYADFHRSVADLTSLRELLEDTPAADVVEVVCCKNCKHLMFSDFYGECTKGYMGIVQPNDYCSKGERKESE